MEQKARSPRITHLLWGRLEVEGQNQALQRRQALSRWLKGVGLEGDRHATRAWNPTYRCRRVT